MEGEDIVGGIGSDERRTEESVTGFRPAYEVLVLGVVYHTVSLSIDRTGRM